jgi:Flp pilus assembly pilin Flp
MRKKRLSAGQSLAEYGLILALVTVVSISALQLFGGNMGQLLTNACTTISDAVNAAIGQN